MELAWLQKSLLYVYIHQYIYLHLTELVTENWKKHQRLPSYEIKDLI